MPDAPLTSGMLRKRAKPKSEDVSGQAFRHAARLLLALDFHHDFAHHLDHAALDLDGLERALRPHARAHRHRRGESHPVEAVVDRELLTLETPSLGGACRARQVTQDRQREVAVGDRPAERPSLRALDIDVNPLMIHRHVCEIVNAPLVYLEPVGVRRRFADARGQRFICGLQVVGHGFSPCLCCASFGLCSTSGGSIAIRSLHATAPAARLTRRYAALQPLGASVSRPRRDPLHLHCRWHEFHRPSPGGHALRHGPRPVPHPRGGSRGFSP